MKPLRILTAFLLLVTSGLASAGTPGEINVGGVLPDTALHALSGPAGKLSAFRGKPLIINVWASWCGPCRAEMGSLERLSRYKNGKEFAVIGISTDDYPEAATAFLKQAKTTFPHFIDRQLVLENMLGANHIPLTVLVDARGKVLGKYYGAQAWDSPQALAVVSQVFQLAAPNKPGTTK